MPTTSAPAGAAAGARHLTLQCQFCQSWNRVDVARVADRPKCGKCERPMLLDRPFTLTADSFSRTLQESEVPVLVDFYADWCGPCKVMAPAVDELARQAQGRALIAKLDTDRAPQITQELGIRGIPTSIVFDRGKEIARQTGAVPLAGLQALLAKAAG
jgi:thioredoxin 2